MCALPEIQNAKNVVCNQAADIFNSKKTEYYTDGYTMILQNKPLGQVVKLLANGEYTAGTYNIDIYEDGLLSGAYFIRLQNQSLQKVLNIVKMK